jgi:hypothetical protein
MYQNFFHKQNNRLCVSVFRTVKNPDIFAGTGQTKLGLPASRIRGFSGLARVAGPEGEV